MRFIAGIMIWLSLGLTIALLAVCSVYTWMKYTEMEGVPAADGSIWDVNPIEQVILCLSLNSSSLHSQDLSVYLQLKETWLGLFIVSVSLCAIILLVTIFLRKRLRIAIALISEASKAVGSIMSSVFFPIFTFLLQLVVMVWWVVVFIFLASSMEKQFTMKSHPSTEDLSQECKAAVEEMRECFVDDRSIPLGCECTFTGLSKISKRVTCH